MNDTNSRYSISKYNYYTHRKEGVVIYNARTGVFSLLTNGLADKLMSGSVDDICDDDLCRLEEYGAIHNGNETDLVMGPYIMQRTRRDTAHITIVPTLQCNFSCSYCFQSNYQTSKVMSEQVQTELINFISRLIDTGRRSIVITWFGGEPLVAKDVVLDLSRRIQNIVLEKDASIDKMTMITNGTMLNEVVAQELSHAGLSAVQITFDSYVFSEGEKRGVVNSDGTESVIMSNVLSAKKYLDVNARINIAQENMVDANKIIDHLKSNGIAVNGISRIHNNEHEHEFETNSDGLRLPLSISECSKCNKDQAPMRRHSFAQNEQDLLLDYDDHDSLKALVGRLKPKAHFCSASRNSMFTIDPAGDVSGCWHSAGSTSERLGTVYSSIEDIEASQISDIWKKYSPISYKSCKSCKVLPLCMGGCSHPRLFMDAKKPPCEPIKFQIQQIVDRVAKYIEI